MNWSSGGLELAPASIPEVLSTLAAPSQAHGQCVLGSRVGSSTVRQLPLERTGSEPKTTEISTWAVSQHRAQLLPCHNWCSGGLLARTNTLGSWDWTLASSRSGEMMRHKFEVLMTEIWAAKKKIDDNLKK